jgi:hypothetical protein
MSKDGRSIVDPENLNFIRYATYGESRGDKLNSTWKFTILKTKSAVLSKNSSIP